MGVFISIASYCDPVLGFTLGRALATARHPELLHFGVVDQSPKAMPAASAAALKPARLSYLNIEPRVCARALLGSGDRDVPLRRRGLVLPDRFTHGVRPALGRAADSAGPGSASGPQGRGAVGLPQCLCLRRRAGGAPTHHRQGPGPCAQAGRKLRARPSGAGFRGPTRGAGRAAARLPPGGRLPVRARQLRAGLSLRPVVLFPRRGTGHGRAAFHPRLGHLSRARPARLPPVQHRRIGRSAAPHALGRVTASRPRPNLVGARAALAQPLGGAAGRCAARCLWLGA